MPKEAGEIRQSEPEITLPESVVIDSKALAAGVELIRAMQNSSELHAKEARVRGDTQSARIARQAAETAEHEASGAIELLGTLMPPPEGTVNWIEAIEKLNS